jgi:hypothetical protein
MIEIPNRDNIRNEIFKEVTPAIKPIIGGPINKPIIPMEETAAMATGGGKILDLLAALNTKGTPGDTPIPTNNIPKVAGNKKGKATAVNKPVAMHKPQTTIIFLNPK